MSLNVEKARVTFGVERLESSDERRVVFFGRLSRVVKRKVEEAEVLERRQRVPATLHDLVSVRVAIVQKSIGLAAVIGPEVRRHGVRMRHDDRALPAEDRKSVVSGKSVSVRVDLGGRRILKKKTRKSKRIIHY